MQRKSPHIDSHGLPFLYEVLVRKTTRRFETVPLTEVFEKAVEVNGHQKIEKTTKKDQPYWVPKVVSANARREDR